MNDNNDSPQQVLGWQRKTSEVVYENPWIKVNHETVVTPTGTDGIYGVVHFKNHAVGVLPIDDRGWTWLVRQSRYPHGEYTWEIPEGGAPKGEDLAEAGRRELSEETGVIAEDLSLWLELQLSNSVTDEVATIFLAEGVSQKGTMKLDETEDITAKHLPLSEALAMVYSGEIVDAMSVAALLKLAADPKYQHWL